MISVLLLPLVHNPWLQYSCWGTYFNYYKYATIVAQDKCPGLLHSTDPWHLLTCWAPSDAWTEWGHRSTMYTTLKTHKGHPVWVTLAASHIVHGFATSSAAACLAAISVDITIRCRWRPFEGARTFAPTSSSFPVVRFRPNRRHTVRSPDA